MTHVLVAEQLIIDRIIDQVPDFKTVDNPSLLAGLNDIGPLLPGCFVMPGPADISSQQTNGTGVVEEQDWQLIIIVAHQAFKNENRLTEDTAGELMQACIGALSGWRPGQNEFFRPFTYAGRAEPNYNSGYAEFPLSFKIRKMVIS
jgi:hypothetical protein